MATTDKAIIAQIKSEYEEGRSYLEPKKTRWVAQLQLLNNLQRGSQNIASTTLYSFFNRVFSSLYSNVMTTKFIPGNDVGMKATEGLNKLQISDYQEMSMDMLQWDWTWDACFFGRGYLETLNYDKKRKLMMPTVLNPLFFSYDPYFSDVQKWRYYDKWILRSKHEIEWLIKEDIIDGVKSADQIETGVDPYIWQYKIQVELAKDVNPAAVDSIVPQSGIYQILEHYMYIDGDKYVVWTNKSITKILRKYKLDLEDDVEHEGESLWPIVPKQIFREPHSSAMVSVPDLIEDKHRALNVMLNLAYISAKDEVNPIYEYVPEMLQSPAQLFQRQINQHIPVNELGKAISPIKKNTSLSPSALQFINIMKQEASDIIGAATPPLQGAKKGKQNSSQDAMLQQIADLATSLQGKLVAVAEKELASHWYQRLIHNKEDGDTKMAVITDALGTTIEEFELDDIETKFPPRINVVAAKEAEYKETVERREIAQQLSLIQGTCTPAQFRLFLKNFWFPKFKTFDLSSIDLVFPKTLDEIKAEQENESLTKGIWVDVLPTDDHETHLYIHSRGKKTAEMWTHIIVHEYALAEQKKKQADDAAKAAAAAGGGDPNAAPGGTPGGGAAAKPTAPDNGGGAGPSNTPPAKPTAPKPAPAATPALATKS